MKLSYSEVWADTIRLLRENFAIIAALAGVFLFLPTLLTSYLIPPPDRFKDLQQYFDLMLEYWTVNWLWLLLARLVNFVGEICILLLLLGPRGRTVGSIIAAALAILPFFFLATLISNLMIAIGFLLLIAPAVYLLGRLCLIGPVVVAEGQRNPIAVISRSFDLTKGKGWALAGLVLLVALPGMIVIWVIVRLLGIIFALAAGADLAALLVKIVEALCMGALIALITVLFAAIYCRLGAKSSPAAAAD